MPHSWCIFQIGFDRFPYLRSTCRREVDPREQHGLQGEEGHRLRQWNGEWLYSSYRCNFCQRTVCLGFDLFSTVNFCFVNVLLYFSKNFVFSRYLWRFFLQISNFACKISLVFSLVFYRYWVVYMGVFTLFYAYEYKSSVLSFINLVGLVRTILYLA